MATDEPVKYQAEFRQPIGHLNPMQLRVSQPVTVEVFSVGKSGTRWKARTLTEEKAPAKVLAFEDKSEMVGTSADHCQRLVGQYFEERLSEWRKVGLF